MATPGQDLYISNVPKSSQHTVLIIACLFLTTSWVTTFLRIWVRAGLIKNFGWDDGMMVFTTAIFTVFCTFTISSTTLAASGDLQQFSPAKTDMLLKEVISAFASYVMTMIVFKIALALFFFRIVVRRWHKWTVYVVVAVNTTYGLFYFFIVLFRCGNPEQYLQNQLLGKCLTNETIYAVNLTSGIINAVTDWALAILPIFILRKADLPLRTRLAVCFVLMLGTIGSIVSIVRLPYIKGLAMGPNFFRNAVDTTIWSVIEPGIGITAACLITLKPLFKCVGDRTRASRSRSTANPQSPTLPKSDGPAGTHQGSFSTWRTEQTKYAGYEEVEMQQRLQGRPTFQDRLNLAKEEEESRTSFATTRSPNGQASIYSDRDSIRSCDTRNFSRTFMRPTPPLPPLDAQLQSPLPTHESSRQRSFSERIAPWEYQHGRQQSKQTL